MNKTAIIVQRYGADINGGAEYHAKCIAELLAKKNEITVLTTKATDYNGWENKINVDEEIINNIKVKRFTTLPKYNHLFKEYRRKILFNKWYHRFLKNLNIFNFLRRKTSLFEISENDSNIFLKAQGPFCPSLIDYLIDNKHTYDCFIFFTYLYYPTVEGLKKVGEKSIFIPTVHDEPLLFSKPYQSIFSLPKMILFNTESERKLVLKHFKNDIKNTDIVGLGIDNQDFNFNTIDLKYQLNFTYFIYIGRIEKQKGCDLMIDYFLKSTINTAVKLVLVGNDQHYQKHKNNDRIIFTGFVSNEEKYYLLHKSIALIIPSPYESLSLVTLESMQQQKLVLANKNCEVLKEHIIKSKAGFVFDDAKSFDKSLHQIINLEQKEYTKLALNGFDYVAQKYDWKVIEHKITKAIDFVINN